MNSRLAFIVAGVVPGVDPRGEVVPPRPAPCLRVGRDHGDTFADHVGPVGNGLWISLF